MTDEITHTIMPSGGSGWGGTALGAGFGGLLGSWLGNGFGGFGRGAGGYDAGALNALQGQITGISSQVANADRDLLMQTSNQNQFVGNLINATGDSITGAINASSQATQQGIYNNSLQQVKSQGDASLAMCQGFGGISAGIAQSASQLKDSLCQINNNITTQNYENRLQAQQLAAQQQQCCCQILQKIEQEGCANRELQRQIQTEAIQSALNDAKNQNAALLAQINLSNQLAASQANQNQYLISVLKPATAASAG